MSDRLNWDRILSRLGSEGDPVPLITETTIPKFLSSFPGIYAGKYPTSSDATFVFDEKKSLLPRRNRVGIDWLTKELSQAHFDSDEMKNKLLGRTLRSLIPSAQKTHVLPKNFFPQSKEPTRSGSDLWISEDRNRTYLDSIKEPADRAIAQLVLTQTEELSTPTIVHALLESWRKFESAIESAEKKKQSEQSGEKNKYEECPPIFLIDNTKIGSEWWLLFLLNSIWRLPDPIIVGQNETPHLSSHCHWNLVVIDDVLFSGQHQMGLLDEFLHHNKETNVAVDLHVIVPYVTKRGMGTIKSLQEQYPESETNIWLKSIHFYPVAIVHTIKELLKCHELSLEAMQKMTGNENLFFNKEKCPLINYLDK